jgi:glycolate oxidase FAD binding subunit
VPQTDIAPFALGGRVPSAAFAPRTVEELAALVRAAHAHNDAVVFFGGGTLQGMGNLPARYDVAISLQNLGALIAHESHDLTIGAGAGMTVAALDRTLAPHGQFVPLDAPFPERGTLGGLLAAGWAGPRRLTYGRPRDLVIGTTAVLADGTIAAAGGMVVKNVTGYDMSKLYAGSLGTLGALVRVNFKTLPRPQAMRAAIAPLPELTRERAMKHVAVLDTEPVAALMVDGFEEELDGHDGDDGRLLLFFEGSARVIERATRECRAQLGAAGVPATRLVDRGAAEILQHAINAYVTPRLEGSLTYRSTGSATTLVERANVFARLAHDAGLRNETITDLRTGDVIARISASTRDDLATAAVPFDDTLRDQLDRVALLDAPADIRGELDAWGKPPATMAHLRELKERFDPAHLLAPGRLPGRL